MPQTTLSIRMDEDLKKQLEKHCNDFGMNISTAITVFAKAVVRQHKIPFEIVSDVNDYSFEQAVSDSLNRENLHGPFDTAEDAVASMLED